MSENEAKQSGETESKVVDYAFWDVPGSAVKVVYSLPLFHEIDFVVNEGYRKIPHGGIEVGGLLFGSIQKKDSVRIEAFRPIECEHASGPSLNFSERDLAELEKQLADAGSDHELEKLKPVGWFLAHTRGPLDLTDAEVKQFDSFFPDPLQLTVLVKPERFQPTRFGFLVRKADGEMPREATASAVILPLPGRSNKPGQLIASIPAPAASSTVRRVTPKPSLPLEDEEPPPPPVQPSRPKAVDPPPLSIWKIPPEPDDHPTDPHHEPAHDPEPYVDFRSPAERAARRQLARDRARVMEQASPDAPMFRPAALPSLPVNAALPHLAAAPVGFMPVAEYEAQESVLNTRSLTALALAAVLGCLVGYIGYLQLPAPVIPMDVRSVNQTIVVSWPPEETRGSIYAAIRFNDGAPVPLSADEKSTGHVSLAAAKDFKVEVMARNWVRDSRGVVRYMHSANGNGQVIPSETIPPK